MGGSFNHSALNVSASETDLGDEPSKTWMVSFADLMAILLTFMVIGFSTSKVEEPVWDGISDSVRTVFGGVPSSEALLDQDHWKKMTSRGLAASYVADLLIDRIPELNTEPVTLEVTDEGVELDMTKLLGNEKVISEIVEILTRIDNDLIVKVRAEEPGTKASEIERLLAWEQAMSDAAVVREALMGKGLVTVPRLSVELSEKVSVGARVVIASNRNGGRR
jgi:MotA/MotB-like proton-channel complex protein